MARGCARIDSRLDTAKIGSDGRVEVHRARLLAVFGDEKRFHTAWVIFRLRAAFQPGPLIPQQRTCGDCIGMSVSCQEATLESHPRGAFHCSAHAKKLASVSRQSPVAVQDWR